MRFIFILALAPEKFHQLNLASGDVYIDIYIDVIACE